MIRWKYITLNGIKTYYRIYDDGKVFNEKRHKFLKLRVNNTGYMIVHIRITKLGLNAYIQVHRLVATAFIPNPDNLPQVNHKDGDKTNNNVSNLEWVSAQENTIHAYRTGLAKIRHGEESGNSSYTDEQIENLCKLMCTEKHTIAELTSLTGVRYSTITKIRNREIWTHISKKYPITQTIGRFIKLHQFVDGFLVCRVSTTNVVDMLMKDGLTATEARNLVQNRRKYLKSKHLI